MLLETLIQRIIDNATELLDAINTDAPFPNLALRRSARLSVLTAIYTALQRPVLLLTDRNDHALTLADELDLWASEAPRRFFPEPNPLFYENAPWGPGTRRDRLAVLTQMASYHIPGSTPFTGPPIVIASARALMARTMPRREFLKATRYLKLGQTIQPDELARNLVSMGFEPANTVITTGQFARRGGILDLWPQAEPQPTRIEFFGDEVDTLRRFDPATQRTTGSQDRILISPAREFILPPAEGSPVPLEEISEFHIPLLHPSPASLLDYLPEQGLVMVDNADLFRDTINDIEEKALSLRSDSLSQRALPEDFPLPYLTWTEIQDALSTRQTVGLGPATEAEKSDLAQKFASGSRFAGRLKPLMDHLSNLNARGESFTVVSRQASRLRELWGEQFPNPSPLSPEPVFVDGSLSEGWVFTPTDLPHAPKLHLLTDGEIFGWRRPEPRRRYRGPAEAPESAYADLQAGDWVVHVDYGIGRFLGLVNRQVEGVEREYLAVEYAQRDQLFVPVHQADRLTRYVGPDSREPSPNRLGGVEWRNAKSRVKEAVEEVAEDLLELYAQRQVVKGYAFSPDSPWQHELEASFPYIETEDQLRVLAEVKQDMETPRPMDRLICGDVGYGKTEIALRAAFKAVMDGRQVALLVPTTILAQQHYNTFQDRLRPFPVEVEMLSRFRTPQQQRKILFRLAAGGIDIVIGTHRLLQEDVEFKDLGLLIIDEEQRFGVTHKEYLKKKRTEVDVLTLTATPIPRTLYMTLTGVRDISTIDTPPEERLPIITHVGPYSKRLVRQAILRELDRGGQVFFVHNRVQTISGMRYHLERLVPEARITVAHGQMPEDELSTRMEQFSAGEVDVLLSTSIIESGLDIPNANTLIVDRADTFGLAQLYQLRGRVGRGAQRAYAYFFKHRRKVPTLEGRQRLETLAENTQLGAGFSIAMRDLEIRGAGDILGTRQHGHIAAVGFHLYTRLLADSVSSLRSERGLPAQPFGPSQDAVRPLVNVDLPLDIGIPADYVPDKNMRLRLYRRIANLRSSPEIEALTEEFRDRFGPLPEQVENLLYQLKIKLLAEKAGLKSVSAENKQIALRFRGGETPATIPNLGSEVRVGRTALWFPFSVFEDWRASLEDLLQKLQTRRREMPVHQADF
jgi:transcription-repair coupling factor (superfamily II helicase)